MKMLKSILFVACLFPCAGIAQNPGSAYIKNNESEPLHIWVNASYQGYVRPGETRYSVSDGFITNDSGNGHDGKPVKESHGGWDNDSKDKVTITYQFGDGEKKTREVSVNDRGEAILGATDKEGAEPKLPSEGEREAAPAVLKGSKPDLKERSSTREEKVDKTKAVAGMYFSEVERASYRIRLAENGVIFIDPGSSGQRMDGQFDVSGDNISFTLTRVWGQNGFEPGIRQTGTIRILGSGILEYGGVRFLKQ